LRDVEIWDAVRRAANGVRNGSRRCAVSYVSNGGYLKLGGGDTLVVNAGIAAMRAGATTKRALADYVARGVDVFNVSSLHAKVFVLGDVAIVGSSNVSTRAAHGYTIEAATWSDSRRFVSDAAGF